MDKENAMSRRDVLKTMGAAALSAAWAWTGLASATSLMTFDGCSGGKKRIVFYFTATGNSLYVARSLTEMPISIPQAMKDGNLDFKADEIGFVFPDYAATAPLIVREFVEKAKFNAPYIFSVITFGNFAANVAEWWDDFCKSEGVNNNYVNILMMVDNYLPVFDMNEQIKIDKNIPENLSKIIADIDNHQNFVSHFDVDDNLKGMLSHLQADHFPMEAERLLKLDESLCIACATCEDVCPHRNFRMKDGKANVGGSCEYCLACVHACPQKALTLVRGERNPKARFRNENISLIDIKKSNSMRNVKF